MNEMQVDLDGFLVLVTWSCVCVWASPIKRILWIKHHASSERNESERCLSSDYVVYENTETQFAFEKEKDSVGTNLSIP
jgi:hypothetical protein